MSTRVQVVMDEMEREAFRSAAAREGLSLSDWLRRAARDRLSSVEPPKLDSVDSLRAFFGECDDRELGIEPDWHEHRGVIEESMARGRSAT
jgi:hypothetical protein